MGFIRRGNIKFTGRNHVSINTVVAYVLKVSLLLCIGQDVKAIFKGGHISRR